MNTESLARFVILLAALGLAAAAASAATWAPISSGGLSRAVEVLTTSTFPIPTALSARGGVLKFTLVGGGEGGSASRASCDDYAIQGGKGGDGGEVVDLEVTLLPGQCSEGIGIVVGPAGRGAYRAGNGVAGEGGGQTSISCVSTTMSIALGGGRRPGAMLAPKSTRGGSGGVVMNTLDQAIGETIAQRSTAITIGSDGQSGRGGYGSGGGGGGASVVISGSMVKQDGTVVRRDTKRNAPAGKPGYGAGIGAGPVEYSSESLLLPAENSAQYGAGGGGGGAVCGGQNFVRDGGNGYQGLVKIQWSE